jgi:hypothetical protein
MKTPIQFILAPPVGVPYSIVPPADIDPDDVCLICQEPYNTADGCVAVRLQHCGHVVGYGCFIDWASRMPNTCTHWNHHLPIFQFIQVQGPLERVLAWICATRLFRAMDSYVFKRLVLIDSILVVGKDNTVWGYSQLWLKHALATMIGVIPSMVLAPIFASLLSSVCQWSGHCAINEQITPMRRSSTDREKLLAVLMFSITYASPLVLLASVYLVLVGCVFSLAWWKHRVSRIGSVEARARRVVVDPQ